MRLVVSQSYTPILLIIYSFIHVTVKHVSQLKWSRLLAGHWRYRNKSHKSPMLQDLTFQWVDIKSGFLSCGTAGVPGWMTVVGAVLATIGCWVASLACSAGCQWHRFQVWWPEYISWYRQMYWGGGVGVKSPLICINIHNKILFP